jgi:hypothetical protein
MNRTVAMTIWPPNSPTLFSIAVDSAKRIVGDRRVGGHAGALVSVVFAAAALEAFLNESVFLAEMSLRRKVREARRQQRVLAEPPTVSTFAQVMKEAEVSRAQIQSKFQLARIVLSGQAHDKGSAPYQDFTDLMAVRNLLMHGKSTENFLTVDSKPSVVSPVAILESLAKKKILHEHQPGQKGFITVVGDTALADLIFLDELAKTPPKRPASGVTARWTYVIGTKAVAEWACNTAARMATDLINTAPISSWKELMHGQFHKAFSPPFDHSAATKPAIKLRVQR